ncbi:hypothetical protein [Nocardiopsis sp. JB363]|uniref:hypothetical protein n=1 Tax=Nocardiopsis sp. JB363 TaxID=1434837 RepID=UPI001F336D03|nr:hypothetical protein [Nocardiopsis sp. JB363]
MARRAIATLSLCNQVIPEATDGQARLESLFLSSLDHLHKVEHHEDPPFAIERCTPGHDALIVHIARPHLTQVLNACLPCAVPDQDFMGIPGLRVHRSGRYLVLHHLNLAGRILIEASQQQWMWAHTWLRTGSPTGTVWPWAENPKNLLPIEHDALAWRAPARPGPVAAEAAQLGSAFLRRLGLLRGTPVKGCWPFYKLWSNPRYTRSDGSRLMHLEWGSHPDAQELARMLTDARSAIALPAHLRQRTQVHPTTGWVRLHTALGNQILLRHNPLEDLALPGEVAIPDRGPHRPPVLRPAHEEDSRVLVQVIDALTGEYGQFTTEELRVTRRAQGGWDLYPPTTAFGYLEHLRKLAFSRTYPGLWPADIEDTAVFYDGREVVRVRGVDFVVHPAC